MSEGGALDGRVALVTGAGRGLGRAYALALAARGARVAVNNRSAGAADDVVEEIRAAGGEAVACPGDLEDPEAPAAVVAAAVGAFGRLDVLVNNAGGAEVPLRPFGEDATAERDAMMRQNFTTAWDATAAAWPHLAAAGSGRVVLCGSPLALYGAPGYAPYAAAKGALIGLARTLAVEGAEHGVATNVLLPVANTRTSPPANDFDRWFAANLRVEPVAAAVAWLADERCTANGEVLSVAGPRIARIARTQTRGYLDDPAAFTTDSVGAHWDVVLDPSDPLEFGSLGEVIAYWSEVFGPA
jgi:NAD(P)-dependent dehydrogenase (short-subunit alcohol dehydrogenase family)